MAQMSKVSRNNTRVHKWENGFAVELHGTKIVWCENGVLQLVSGGYRTATTKARMNQVSNQMELGYQVYSDKGDWYVDTPAKSKVPFEDGMKFKVPFTSWRN